MTSMRPVRRFQELVFRFPEIIGFFGLLQGGKVCFISDYRDCRNTSHVPARSSLQFVRLHTAPSAPDVTGKREFTPSTEAENNHVAPASTP